jgi:aquaporin related protein
MVITGNLPWFRGLLLLPAELLGGIVAAALVRCMFPGPLSVNTLLSNGTTPAQGVFIEMFLTALLVFTILMLAAEKHYATFMAPVGIGLALFVAMMAGMREILTLSIVSCILHVAPLKKKNRRIDLLCVAL